MTGNLEISLFFEEKFVLCFKIFQLYGVLFLFFYEEFPSKIRKSLTPVLMAFNLNFHISEQRLYYHFMHKDSDWKVYAAAGYVFLTLILLIIFLTITCPGKCHYRCNQVWNKKFNYFRWFFWIIELTMLPVLTNLAWGGTCAFATIRPAIEVDLGKECNTF